MSTASKIERITGRAIALRGHDIDTDRIIPARFLRAITFDGLEAHLFEDDRKALSARGNVHPFDRPAHRSAQILFTNANFGCGSSREHAPQAIARWGIHAIVGESFGEIFFGNSVMIGLPCLTASAADIEQLMSMTEERPDTAFAVDIREGRITGGGLTVPLTLPAGVRDAFISGGWDATGLLLDEYGEVERTAARLPYVTGFR